MSQSNPPPTQTRRSTRGVRPATLVACSCLALAVGGASGWLAATLRHQSVAVERALATAVERSADQDTEAEPASHAADSVATDVFLDALSDNIELGERVRDLESLLDAIRDLGANPLDLVDLATERLSDSDLQRLLKLSMRLDDEQLESIVDLRAYTKRVAEIAMDGSFGEPSPTRNEAKGPEIAQVSVSGGPGWGSLVEIAPSLTPPDSRPHAPGITLRLLMATGRRLVRVFPDFSGPRGEARPLRLVRQPEAW